MFLIVIFWNRLILCLDLKIYSFCAILHKIGIRSILLSFSALFLSLLATSEIYPALLASLLFIFFAHSNSISECMDSYSIYQELIYIYFDLSYKMFLVRNILSVSYKIHLQCCHVYLLCCIIFCNLCYYFSSISGFQLSCQLLFNCLQIIHNYRRYSHFCRFVDILLWIFGFSFDVVWVRCYKCCNGIHIKECKSV